MYSVGNNKILINKYNTMYTKANFEQQLAMKVISERQYDILIALVNRASRRDTQFPYGSIFTTFIIQF